MDAEASYNVVRTFELDGFNWKPLTVLGNATTNLGRTLNMNARGTAMVISNKEQTAVFVYRWDEENAWKKIAIIVDRPYGWSVRNRDLHFAGNMPDHSPVDLTFPDDGNKLYVGFYQGGGSVETFILNISLATWVRTERIHGDNIGRAVAVSSDGSVLVTTTSPMSVGDSNGVFVYSANTTGRLELPRFGSRIDVSGDGGRIMVVERDSNSQIDVWSIRVYDTYENRSDVYNDVTFGMVLNEEQILHPDISIAISPNPSFLVVATSHTVRTFFDERCPALGPAPPYSPPPAPPPPPRSPPTPPPPPMWGGVSLVEGNQIPGTYDYNFTVIADTPAWFASLRLQGQNWYTDYIYSQNETVNPFTRVLPGPGQYTMVIQPAVKECEEKEHPFMHCRLPTYMSNGYGNNLLFETKNYLFEVIGLPPQPPSPPPPSPPPQAPWPPIAQSLPHPPFNSTAGDAYCVGCGGSGQKFIIPEGKCPSWLTNLDCTGHLTLSTDCTCTTLPCGVKDVNNPKDYCSPG